MWPGMPILPKKQIWYFLAIKEKTQKKWKVRWNEKWGECEADFLHAHKHESFLKIETMIFDEDGQTFPKSPK